MTRDRCGHCGGRLGDDAPSLYFCGEPCQRTWHQHAIRGTTITVVADRMRRAVTDVAQSHQALAPAVAQAAGSFAALARAVYGPRRGRRSRR